VTYNFDVLISILKKSAVLIGHTLVALFGTAIVSLAVGKFFPVTSVAGVVRKEWLLSAGCSMAIGALMYRTWRSRLARWVWVAPFLWFAFGALMLLPTGDVWRKLFALDHSIFSSPSEWRYFALFTVPLIRSIGYSIGTLLGSWTWRDANRTIAEVKAVGF
jgi:hypothetical protein